jgi:GT2 family glycosyltransferase
MDLSVLIPTFRRLAILRRCLAALAEQHTSARWEILIGVDGGEGAPTESDIPPRLRPITRVESYPKVGYISVRHRMLTSARGRIFLSINDDVYACPDFVERHARAHADGPRLVSGRSDWLAVERPTLFDQLVQRSNLLFFAPPTDRAPTYRDCYGLNMSAPTRLALDSGGFPDMRDAYGYDDTELAHRLIVAGATMLIEPRALVTHDHRYTPMDVLKREYLLGRSAWAYAQLNPGFARDLFGRDIRAQAELDHAARFLEHERRDAVRIQSRFLALASFPPLPDDTNTQNLLATLADSWTLLKRYLWRQGLLAASRGEPNASAPLE